MAIGKVMKEATDLFYTSVYYSALSVCQQYHNVSPNQTPFPASHRNSSSRPGQAQERNEKL
jgi:hypothetical protein